MKLGAAMATAALAAGLWRAAVRRRIESAHARRLASGSDGVVLGAEGFELRGEGARAALLLHGFNDTPQSMRYLAAQLLAQGYTVAVPRLPGHGCDLASMAMASRAAAWQSTVAEAYATLRAAHADVLVCGQSMGGALAVLLAERHPDIPALVLLAPYLGMPPWLQWKVMGAWIAHGLFPYRLSVGNERSIHDPVARAQSLGPGVVTARTLTELRRVAEAAEAALPSVVVPTLYLQSRADNRIRPTDARRAFARIGSTEKEQRWLTGCGHIISSDYCREDVALAVIGWGDRFLGKSATQG